MFTCVDSIDESIVCRFPSSKVNILKVRWQIEKRLFLCDSINDNDADFDEIHEIDFNKEDDQRV